MVRRSIRADPKSEYTMSRRFEFYPDHQEKNVPAPQVGDHVRVGTAEGVIVAPKYKTFPTQEDFVFVEVHGKLEAIVPIKSLRLYDYYRPLRQYSHKRVQVFLKDLLGPLEQSSNDERLQVHARSGNALQFLYCLLESHASIANNTVAKLIERFDKMGAWEMANIMFGLEGAIRRRITHAARYWVNMARSLDAEEAVEDREGKKYHEQ